MFMLSIPCSKAGRKYTKTFCFNKTKIKNIFNCFYYFCISLEHELHKAHIPKTIHMFHKIIKLIITAAINAYAVYQFIDGEIGNGIFLVLLSTIFIFLYFRNEILLMAFLRMRKQDLAGTERWLNKIKNPEAALTSKQQGYYNYLHGIINSQTNLSKAEKYFKKAVKLGLNMDYDMAMAKLSLAGISMQKRRKREATTLLAEAKKLDKQNMLGDQIKMMKQQLKRI
jgi:tetratricopeptide (TPR) repeat protein